MIRESARRFSERIVLKEKAAKSGTSIQPKNQPAQEEHVMKLSPAQVEKTVSQLQIEAIPDSHPLVPQLNRLFGEHTYFIDKNGLNIVEPASGDIDVAEADANGMGVVVNVAHWTSANPPKLEAHEPQPTESLVALKTDGGG
jgi:hypothetical protein